MVEAASVEAKLETCVPVALDSPVPNSSPCVTIGSLEQDFWSGKPFLLPKPISSKCTITGPTRCTVRTRSGSERSFLMHEGDELEMTNEVPVGDSEPDDEDWVQVKKESHVEVATVEVASS